MPTTERLLCHSTGTAVTTVTLPHGFHPCCTAGGARVTSNPPDRVVDLDTGDESLHRGLRGVGFAFVGGGYAVAGEFSQYYTCFGANDLYTGAMTDRTTFRPEGGGSITRWSFRSFPGRGLVLGSPDQSFEQRGEEYWGVYVVAPRFPSFAFTSKWDPHKVTKTHHLLELGDGSIAAVLQDSKTGAFHLHVLG